MKIKQLLASGRSRFAWLAVLVGVPVLAIALGGYWRYQLARPKPTDPLAMIPQTAITVVDLNLATLAETQTQPWQAVVNNPPFSTWLNFWQNQPELPWSAIAPVLQNRDRVILASVQITTTQPSADEANPELASPTSSFHPLVIVPRTTQDTTTALVNTWQQQTGSAPEAFQWRGVDVYQFEANPVLYLVVFDNFWLVTSHFDVLEQAITAAKGIRSLAAVPDFRPFLVETAAATNLLNLYVNGEAIVQQAIMNRPILPWPPLMTQTWLQLSPTTEGLTLKGIARLPSPRQPIPPPTPGADSNNLLEITRYFPADTQLLMVGHDLGQYWRFYEQQPAILQPWFLTPTQLRTELATLTNMDLEADWLSWLDGDFAIALVPIPKTTPSDFLGGVIILAEVSDRQKAQQSLAQLDQIAAKQYGFQVSTKTWKTVPVTAWLQTQTKPLFMHGWLNENLAFMALGSPLLEQFVPQPQQSLAQIPQFKRILPDLLPATHSLFFMSRGEQQQVWPFPAWSAWLADFQGVGAIVSSDAHGLIRYEVEFHR